MSLDADLIVDRRRMRRKLTFWRVVAVLIADRGGRRRWPRPRGAATVLTAGGDYIARVKITGLIRNDQERVESLEKLAKSSSAKAVIVHIDSPGGTTAGSEQLHGALRGVAAAKPLVVVVDGLAASGGYIAAMSADHIVAQETSLVGSIGVLFQYPNVGELLKIVGVKIEEIKSSPLKAAPNGYEPTSPEARAAIEALVKDSYAWFRGMVSDRRKMDGAALETVTDGRVFTGRQALALSWSINSATRRPPWPGSPPKRASKPTRRCATGSSSRASAIFPFCISRPPSLLDAVGLIRWRSASRVRVQAVERLNLDGLLALWHPPMAN